MERVIAEPNKKLIGPKFKGDQKIVIQVVVVIVVVAIVVFDDIVDVFATVSFIIIVLNLVL